ncbi:hypothetical protein TWF281_008167 [Arthrobotrys megalospora]
MRRAATAAQSTARLANLKPQWRGNDGSFGGCGLHAFCRSTLQTRCYAAIKPRPRQKAPLQHILVSKHNKALRKEVRQRQWELKQKGIAIAQIPRFDIEELKREGSEEQRQIWLDILSTITDPIDREVSRKTFQILAVALRRLLATELEQIIKLSIKDLPPEVDKDLFGPNVRRGLLEIDEHGYILFKSKFIKQMLVALRMQNTGPENSYFFIDEKPAHADMARALLTYMGTYGESGPCNTEKERAEREAAYPLLRYAALYWPDHCIAASSLKSALIDVASKFWTTDATSYFGAWIQAHFWYHGGFAKGRRRTTTWEYITWTKSPLIHLTEWGMTEFIEEALLTHPQTEAGKMKALYSAVCSQGEDIASILLNHGADTTSKRLMGAGWNYLHAAVWMRKPAMVRLLLSQPGAIDLINRHDSIGRTPLHLAVLRSNLQMVELLLEHGATADVPANMGCTALHNASGVHVWRIFKRLISAGADPHGPPFLQSPLHTVYGARGTFINDLGDAINMTKTLIESGVSPTTPDADGFTPLHTAIIKNNQGAVEVLLPHYSSDDINAVGRLGVEQESTALTSAFIYAPAGDTIRLLIEKGAKGPHGILGRIINPLIENSSRTNSDTLDLVYKTFPEEISHYEATTGKSVLEMALTAFPPPSRSAITFLKLQQPNWEDSIMRNYEPYFGSGMEGLARSGEVRDIISYATRNPAEGERFPWKDIWETAVDPPVLIIGYRPSIAQFLKFKPEFRTAEYLLPALCKSLSWNSDQETMPLFFIQLVEDLPGTPLLDYMDEETGESLLHLACETGHARVVDRLLNSHGANVNIQDKSGATPLMRCFASNPIDSLNRGIIRELLQHGADPTIQDNEGRTAITHLLMCSAWDAELHELSALELLLAHPATKSILHSPDNSGFRPIDYACQRQLYAATRELIGAGAEMRIKNDKGVELLPHLSLKISQHGQYYPIAEELLSMGADIYAVNEDGKCFIHECLGPVGHCAAVNMLTEELGFDLTIPLPRREGDEETPIELPWHYAARNSPAKAFLMLHQATPKQLEHIVHGRSVDGKESTSLHIATKYGATALVRALIEAGADVNAVDAEGKTPLFYMNRRESGLSIAEGATMEAVTSGYWLLKAGADPNFRNPVTGKTVYESIRDFEGFDFKKPALQLLKHFGATDAEG